MKYFIPILLIFFFSCDDDNLVADNSCTECISIGSEFPLGNRYAVYLISYYNSPEQYQLDFPSNEEIDTLFILETDEDYSLYIWNNSDSERIGLVKNYQGLALWMGEYNPNNSNDITLYEPPYVFADYNNNFSHTNTNNYQYDDLLDSRTTTSISLNDTTYEAHRYDSYAFEGQNSVITREIEKNKIYFKGGMYFLEWFDNDYENNTFEARRLFYQSGDTLNSNFNFNNLIESKKNKKTSNTNQIIG